jgi:ligand-binding sensor domain-containing protein
MAGNPAHAQFNSKNNFKFKTYTTQDGLVHNFTLKSRMDSKGFLWIITQNGLSRFDGYHFTNFQNIVTDTTSLPLNEITDMAIDGSDRIWLAYEKGLCYYDQANHSFLTLDQTAISLTYDSLENKLWFNNSDGLFEMDLKNLRVEPSALQVKYQNKPILTNLDSKQRIWISLINGAGYYVYYIKTKTFRYFTSPFWIRNVKDDKEGNTWICTWWDDLQKYDEPGNGKKNAVFKLPSKSNIQLIFQDLTQSIPLTGPDIIWVAMHTGGIALFNTKENKFIQWWQYDPSVKSGIATDFNSSIYTDPNGIIWICTWKGLTKVNRQEQQFQSEELKFLQSDGYNLLTSIIDDPYQKDFAWIGVNGSGVCYYDKINQKPVKWYYSTKEGYTNLLGNWIWIANGIRDRQNKIWYITYGGFVKVDHGKVSRVAINVNGHPALASTARMLDDGKIWISCDYGLVCFDPVTEQYRFFKQPIHAGNSPPLFFDVVDMNDHEICCATSEGLLKFNKQQGSFEPIPVSQEDQSKKEWRAFVVLEKMGPDIYAGSTSGLLQYHMENGKTTVLGREEQVFHLLRHSLIKDRSGNLWIYTLHGLFKYNPVKKEFKKFTAADGIYDNLSDPVQMFYYNDNIYIGYRMAYTRFDPEMVDVNNNLVKPCITAVHVNNTALKITADMPGGKTWPLTSTENNLQFEYTAPDYTNSEKITFAYMLEGFDKDWINAGTSRKVNYANLKGGDYIFKLKACNSSGLWNENQAVFKFYIRPPIWQRWWFWPLLALLFIGTVLYVAKKRVGTIQRKETEKTLASMQIAESEMKALRSQMNPHFIFNSLNSIHKYIWENKPEDASEYLIKFSKLMRITLENSALKTITLTKEIEALNLYIGLEHRRSSNKFDYRLSIGQQVNADEIQVPPMIFQPYIENAVWHGLMPKEGKGNLIINFDLENDHLVCTIDDNGIGRKKAGEIKKQKQSLHQSVAMTVTADRLKLIQSGTDKKASVEIRDKTDADGMASGTLVIIKLPLTG